MGKIKKRTEYYCDICKGTILRYSLLPFAKDKVYKIKCYDGGGFRDKVFDYTYVCHECMCKVVKEVRKRINDKENKND